MWQDFKREGVMVQQALNVHDENQCFTYPDTANKVGEIMKQAIIKAGEYFNLKCPLDAEYKVGENWFQTH